MPYISHSAHVMKKIKITRFIIIILGSSFFIPVSCSLGIVGGTKVIALLDARDVQKGDHVHSLFSVVAKSKHNQQGTDFIALPLEKAKQLASADNAFSFLMPLSESSKKTDRSHYAYKVLKDQGSEQTIEVVEVYKDGDNTIWSQYRATDKEVFPLASKMFYFGYMFQAVPYALVFALSMYALGKKLKP
ncbi:MAG: hypothetical protein D3910_00855 [Candidatus Electrothrix sp. ATG2]|nr:hypothetical protein [Candidatus Electrothrix sp. ATG2]